MKPTPTNGAREADRPSIAHSFLAGAELHDPADDSMADVILNHLLREPQPDAWAIMLSDRYAEQTARVLRSFWRATELNLAALDVVADEDYAAFQAQEINTAELRERRKRNHKSIQRTRFFQNLVLEWIDRATAAELRARAKVMGPLDELLDAVDTHRRGVTGLGQATKPDRLLWKTAERIRERPMAGPAPVSSPRRRSA